MGRLAACDQHELYAAAKELRAPYELVAETAALGRLPVVLFSAAGGAAPPSDAALIPPRRAERASVGPGPPQSGAPARRPGRGPPPG
ncbi:hypothetical protein CLM85_03170 [Streptomyces albidoflavus]|nr:hypothetical protein CLM85_03170 [Streptomyces albidoflavus]